MTRTSRSDLTPTPSGGKSHTLFSPLSERTFRRIWAAGLLSNFGMLIQGVGAAWEMTRLSASAEDVALVQTAIMLPIMLLILPSGAIADMFDRRKVAIVGLAFASVASFGLTLCAFLGLVTVEVLLGFTFLIGLGVTLYGPAWQSSISEQVGPEKLPSAIALGSINYNVARSFGPALGGLIVAAAGAVAAFAVNAFFYLPAIATFLLWRREQAPTRLPPERIDRAIIAGVRYAFHSPSIRTIVVRTFVTGFTSASLMALSPLVAKDLLNRGPTIYGLLLGFFGAGAVIGAMQLGRLRDRLSDETGARLLALMTGSAILVIGLSRSLPLSLFALLLAGIGWTQLNTLFNVGVQLSAPRWVTARALACYGSAMSGGTAIGAWVWGSVANGIGTGPALVISGLCLVVTLLLGLWLPMPQPISGIADMPESLREPEASLPLTLRSGPIVIEVDYRVDRSQAREFYRVMQDLRRARLRSGAFEWSLARDIADPELWTERYHCPTWGDFLLQRSRLTRADLAADAAASAFHKGGDGGRVRRRLERPFGSVRWRAESPDFGDEAATAYTR